MMTLLLTIVYLAFISLGLPDSLLGAAWPSMRLTLGMPVPAAGPVSMVITAGTVVSSLLSNKVIKRFGTGKVTTVSVAMTALALLGYSFNRSYAWMFVLALPLGLGAGAVDSGLNDFVARHYEAKHMNWLHAFWGIGATAGPLIISGAISSLGGWHIGYRIVAVLQIMLVGALLLSMPAWNKVRKQEVAEAEERKQRGEMGKLKGVVWCLMQFFFYCGGEASAFLWSASFLVGARSISPERAAGLVSLFFVGITAGRMVSGFVSMKLNGVKMIRLGEIIAAVGALMLWIPNAYANVFALFVLGFGFAPIYPMTIHETPRRFGEDNSTRLIGLQMACAYTGSTLVPPVLGFICGRVGMLAFPVLELLFLAAQFLCSERLNKLLGDR